MVFRLSVFCKPAITTNNNNNNDMAQQQNPGYDG